MIGLLLFVGYLLTSIPTLLYVGATDVLPEPLSKEEELFYLSLAQDNDKHARDILIEHNLVSTNNFYPDRT